MTVMPTAADDFQVLERTPDYIISTWRYVMFLAWRGRETVDGILRSRSLMEHWASNRRGGVILVILMPHEALQRPPSEEARKAMEDTSKDALPSFKGIAIIGKQTGFIAAAIRSVMTARQMFMRSLVPFKMFSSAAEAAPWIAQCLGLQIALQSELSDAAEKASWK